MEKVKRIEKSEKNVVKEQIKPKKWEIKRIKVKRKEIFSNGQEFVYEKNAGITFWVEKINEIQSKVI